MNFKSLPLEERIAHRMRGLARRPTHIPVIISKAGDTLPDISCERFLFTPSLTISQLAYVVRRQVKLDADQALFLLCNGLLVQGNQQTILQLYEKHCDPEDGFLYLVYSLEHTFGCM